MCVHVAVCVCAFCERCRPHHALVGVIRVGGLVQQLGVLQLLAHVLQRVERLVQLHRHGHLGQIFANIVPQDVPQVDVAGVRGGAGQARAASVTKGIARQVPIGHCNPNITEPVRPQAGL